MALPMVTYVFPNSNQDHQDSWKGKRIQDMDDEEIHAAQWSWAMAEDEDVEEAKQQDSMDESKDADLTTIRARMKDCLRQWKVAVRELHNATLAAGLSVPQRPSWLR